MAIEVDEMRNPQGSIQSHECQTCKRNQPSPSHPLPGFRIAVLKGCHGFDLLVHAARQSASRLPAPILLEMFLIEFAQAALGKYCCDRMKVLDGFELQVR